MVPASHHRRKRFLTFGNSQNDPSHVDCRRWVIGLEPEAVHERACQIFCTWSTATFSVLLGPDPDSLLRSRPQPLFGPLVAEVVATVRARNPNGIPFGTAVALFERLTIVPGSTYRMDRMMAYYKKHGVRLSDCDKFFGVDFREFLEHWKLWCLNGEPRRVELIGEYDHVYVLLGQALSEAHALDGRSRWEFMRRLVTLGAINVGGLSYKLPRRLPALEPSWAVSEWTEVLLAVKHHPSSEGINRTAIKESLKIQRLERDVHRAWARYEAWLLDQPEAHLELEALLGPVLLVAPSATNENDKR